MNARERFLALALLGAVVLVGGGFVGYQFFWVPLGNRSRALVEVQKKIADKEKQVGELEAKKKQMEYWRALSLPGDVHMAWGEYQKYLNELLAQSEFSPGSMSVKSTREPDTKATAATRGKKPVFTKLEYDLNGSGSLASLVKLLERFYQTPLLHRVKSVDILRPATPRGKPDDLDLKIKVEALIVEGAPKRDTLLPPPESRPELNVLAKKERRYADIATRNIFFAPPQAEAPPRREDVTLHVRLTDITQSDDRVEAFLYDRYNNRPTRLRASAGFNTFRVADDDDKTLVRGQVVRIEERDVVFKVEDKYYRLHLDQTIRDALRQPLSETEVKELKLETASAQ